MGEQYSRIDLTKMQNNLQRVGLSLKGKARKLRLE